MGDVGGGIRDSRRLDNYIPMQGIHCVERGGNAVIQRAVIGLVNKAAAVCHDDEAIGVDIV